MKLTLIQVPYDSGHRARRMGNGPTQLVRQGMIAALEQSGHEARLIEVRIDEDFPTEIGTALATQRVVAGRVAEAVEQGRWPLVLAGNCVTAVGSVAALGGDHTGVFWFDSHGDFNTPETSRSGFFDGMAVAMLIGDCWSEAARAVPDFVSVPESNVVLIAARDLDSSEETRLEESEVRRVAVDAVRSGADDALRQSLAELVPHVDGAYIHVDMDVLDPDVARVNSYQAPDGLTVSDVVEAIDAIAALLPIRAAALTAYDPSLDTDGAGRDAAIAIARALARHAERGRQ